MKNVKQGFLELSEVVIQDSVPESPDVSNDRQAPKLIRRRKWSEFEVSTLKNVLEYGHTLRIITHFLPQRSAGAIIKKAQILGYRRHTNSDGVIEFKYGIKSRNRRTKEELSEAGLVPEVAEEVFDESSTAIIPATATDDKLELARSLIFEALTLINEVSEPSGNSQL